MIHWGNALLAVDLQRSLDDAREAQTVPEPEADLTAQDIELRMCELYRIIPGCDTPPLRIEFSG